MKKRFALAIFTGIIIGTTVIAPMLDRSRPYKRWDGHIMNAETRTGEGIARGSRVTIEYNTIVWKRCPGKATRHVIDGNGMDHVYESHSATIYAQPKDDPTYEITFVLPSANDKSIESDWEYYADLEYYCNWTQRLWPIKDRTPSIFFRPS